MYLRLKNWTLGLAPAFHSETVWENIITIQESDAVDLRFRLKGYGWKPSSSDVDLKTLEKGSYKIYYRVHGVSTWSFHSRVDSDRSGGDSGQVYKDVGFSLGVMESNKYDIKIVADKGSKFTAWGGAIENIVSGGQFWYGLEVRVLGYKMTNVNDNVSISENVGVQLV